MTSRIEEGSQQQQSETSMNFDEGEVRPFLERLSELVTGFGPSALERVDQVLEELEIDDEQHLRFEVSHEGGRTPMVLGLFKGDVDAFDVSFITTEALSGEIESLMLRFAEENGF